MEALQSIQTPAFVVRLAVAERNAKRMLDKGISHFNRLIRFFMHKTVDGNAALPIDLVRLWVAGLSGA
jgi:hypothetical protein